MAKNRTVQLNQIEPNSTVFVKGKLTFARLSKKLEGEELAKDNAKRQSRGWMTIDKPYTTASICNAQVLYASGDPNQKTPAEIFVDESMYTSGNQNYPGYNYSANNKGNGLPQVGELQSDGHTVNQVHLASGQELANGLDVTLIVRVFKGRPNNGISLDGVIVNEPIRYYQGSTMGANLAQRGFTWNESDTGDAEAANATPAPAPAPAPSNQAPQFAPQANPFSNAPQPATQPQQAAPAPAPAPQAQPQQAAPAPQANPFNNAPAPQGIQYDPGNDTRGGYV